MKQLMILINKPALLFKAIPADVIDVLARLTIASVFWRSAQTKVSGWEFLGQNWQFFNLNSSTLMLFQYEYSVPLLNYKVAAYMATFGEFFLSLALILGLLTRLSATGLFLMTLVIQVFVYPDAWPTHILWFALLLYLMKAGPGRFSIDRMLGID